MSILQNSNAISAPAGGGDFYDYQISNSIRFNGTSQALEKTWGSAASDNNKKALSFWIKRSGNGNSAFGSTTNTKLVSANEFNLLEINTGNPSGYSDQLGYGFNNGSVANWFLGKWRDPSAWMHIIWIWNSDESTAVNRLKVYINGVNYVVNDSTYWNNQSGNPYPGSGTDSTFGKNGMEMHIARYQYDNAGWWGGQMADFIMIDGAASYTDFGEFKNGVWKPVDPSGLTFGNNGFHLNFANASAPGNDVSGNNNDFGVIGTIPTHDILGDSPTNNFPTYNGAYKGNNSLAEGNLESTGGGGENNSTTFSMATGKWYWECKAQTVAAYGPTFGIGQSGTGSTSQYYIITWQTNDGQMYGGGGYPKGMGTITVTSTGATSLSSGDILSFWLDCDNRKLWIGKNGTIPNSGNVATGANPQASWATTPTDRYFNATCQNVQTGVGVLNAGQNPSFNGGFTGGDIGTATDKNGYGLFKYDPSGTDFIACCAGNQLVEDAIDPAQTDTDYPQKLFSPTTYSGNDTTNNITGVGFQPDLMLFKIRNTASSGMWVDTNRGRTKAFYSITNDAEVTIANITAIGTDGFSLDGTSNNQANFNGNNNTYASWNWRMNGGTTATNTSGSINSTVQADPSGSMSIVTFTGNGSAGASIGHGLSKKPSIAIFKLRSGANDFMFLSAVVPTKYAYLNTTGAFQAGLYGGGRTFDSATSSLFYLEGAGEMNTSNGSMQAIFFANTSGFISTGEYRGNGNDDGPYIITDNVSPAWILIREYGAADNWLIYDNRRLGYNRSSAGNAVLYVDYHGAEENDASRAIDILSNGFKLRTSNATINANGGNYIYVAMASNPFSYSTAR